MASEDERAGSAGPGTAPVRRPQSPRALGVDDDRDSRDLLRAALPSWTLTFASSAREARDRLADDCFDVVLLDLGLPDGDGLGLCSEILSRADVTPHVILTTADDATRTKIDAFDLGVADYLTKPFDPAELRARVEARLRSARPPPKVVRVGRLRIHLDSLMVAREGERAAGGALELTRTEHRLLCALAARGGEAVSREELLRIVWPETVVGARTVDTHIGNLRIALGRDGARVESVRGCGYRLRIGDEESEKSRDAHA